jgi:hypothetical protein
MQISDNVTLWANQASAQLVKHLELRGCEKFTPTSISIHSMRMV